MDQKSGNVQYHQLLKSPFGQIHLSYNLHGISALDFKDITLDIHLNNIDNQMFVLIKSQLENYFSGQLNEFTLPLNPEGTMFQKKVWEELRKVPYGTTCTYQELATKLGGKEKTRAVAAAIAKNPILILIPCHRVIGSNGKLTGFSGGLDRKRLLLELEGNMIHD